MSITLAAVDQALSTLADLRWAEPWDNTGWLTQPTRPRGISHLLLTIDLTEKVLAQALSLNAQAIIAYHPPIFHNIKRIEHLAPAVRIAIEHRIALYSPHTALDAAPGGVCDWLINAAGPVQPDSLAAIRPAQIPDPHAQFKLIITVPLSHADALRNALARAGAGHIGHYSHCSFNTPGFGTFLGDSRSQPAIGKPGRLEHADELRIEMVCAKPHLPAVRRAIQETHPYEQPAWDLIPLAPQPDPRLGAGRLASLIKPLTLDQAAARIKSFLHLKHLRLAQAPDHRPAKKITRLAVCPGAGGSVFENVRGPELFITGEMRHHDILALNARGASVILTDHTNTERGYLPTYRKNLATLLGPSIKITLASSDHDPLQII